MAAPGMIFMAAAASSRVCSVMDSVCVRINAVCTFKISDGFLASIMSCAKSKARSMWVTDGRKIPAIMEAIMITRRDTLIGAGAFALAAPLPLAAATPTLEQLFGEELLEHVRAGEEWPGLVDTVGFRVSAGFRRQFVSFLLVPRSLDIHLTDREAVSRDTHTVYAFNRHGRLPPLWVFDFIHASPPRFPDLWDGLRLIPSDYVGPLPRPHWVMPPGYG
jgi:hypothetical protein